MTGRLSHMCVRLGWSVSVINVFMGDWVSQSYRFKVGQGVSVILVSMLSFASQSYQSKL